MRTFAMLALFVLAVAALVEGAVIDAPGTEGRGPGRRRDRQLRDETDTSVRGLLGEARMRQVREAARSQRRGGGGPANAPAGAAAATP
jgi:hypothetical protein